MLSIKFLRGQLCYFTGITFEDHVEFMPDFDRPEYMI